MNTCERYLAVVTALILTSSLHLSAMQNQPPVKTKMQEKMAFLNAAVNLKLEDIKQKVALVDLETLQIARENLQGVQESEVYQIIAQRIKELSPEPKKEEKKEETGEKKQQEPASQDGKTSNEDKKDTNKKEGLTCPICTEELSGQDSTPLSVLRCGHRFHKECFAAWARSSVRLNVTNLLKDFVVFCPECGHAYLAKNFLSENEINQCDSSKNPNTEENLFIMFNDVIWNYKDSIDDSQINIYCNNVVSHKYITIIEMIVFSELVTRLTDANLEHVLALAAERNEDEIVKKLLTNQNFLAKISDNALGNAFCLSVENSFMDIVKIFLSCKRLTQKHFEQALSKAHDPEIKKEIEKYIEEKKSSWKCRIQ